MYNLHKSKKSIDKITKLSKDFLFIFVQFVYWQKYYCASFTKITSVFDEILCKKLAFLLYHFFENLSIGKMHKDLTKKFLELYTLHNGILSSGHYVQTQHLFFVQSVYWQKYFCVFFTKITSFFTEILCKMTKIHYITLWHSLSIDFLHKDLS